jgi:16S rRNA (cytosine1402-N4)-methyltransferase
MKLEELLRENADEPRAELLANAIIETQKKTPIKTTRQLGEVVRTAYDARRDEADATIRRVFQALRIEVNDEFSALETFLRFLPQCLKPGGRVAILTFHSGEDRRVKRFFDEGLRSGEYAGISRSVIRPGPVELRANPRSTPAKLRWAVKADPKLP